MIVWFIIIVNYTLSLMMWLIVGRLLLSFFLKNRENFMLGFFIKFTEPLFRITRKLFPFARESCIPFISMLLIVILRITVVFLLKQGK